ncbi:MAG TPA: hypothetical protein VFG15_06375 [Amycolatopsis sp.]|nr:hypothetical protein [Amycolatopsis sp.]
MPYLAGQTLTAAMLTKYVTSVNPSTNATFSAHQVLPDDTVTFMAIASHRYKVSYSTRHSNSSGTATSPAAVGCNLRWVAGAGPITPSSTVIRGFAFPSTGGNGDFSGFKTIVFGVTGLVTVGVSASANIGTSTFNGGTTERELLVEDVNP